MNEAAAVFGRVSVVQIASDNSANERAEGRRWRAMTGRARRIFSSGSGTPPGLRAYVNFVAGSHGSIIDPSAGLNVTKEMQAEAITFTGAPIPPVFPATPAGTTMLMGGADPSVIEP